MPIDPSDFIREWWEKYQPDPRANYDLIVSTTRKQLTTGGEVKYIGGVTQPVNKSNLQTGSCQYWVKGLSPVCTFWDFTSLTCIAEFDDTNKPSGYGTGGCDRLGRRGWCSRYIASAPENLEEYVCVAPCIEKSGLGKQETDKFGSLSYRPLMPSEIKGYNPDEGGVGRCDGWGMGRGAQKEYTLIETIYLDRAICKHYKPQQMGLGAVPPHPYHGSEVAGKPFDPKVNYIPTTSDRLFDGSPADPLTRATLRLPFAFQIYNCRAMYQKCAYWKSDVPGAFIIDDYGGDPMYDIINMNTGTRCECTDASLCNPYRNAVEDWPEGVPYILLDVWASYGGIVCNGAKPECPCYTGQWTYCIDNKMRDGMRVTADQMFELRFWASNWSSQEEYDNYYLAKPGRTEHQYADESTADIYTFTHWEKIDGTDANESIMVGKRHHMCMPAPLHMRYFDPNIFITKELITYPKVNGSTGTNVKGGMVAFPTLVRELENPENYVPDIFIVYPYHTVNPWDAVECDDSDVPNWSIHDSNLMTDSSFITFVGYTTSDKDVYVISADIATAINGSLAKNYFDSYTRATQIPGSTWLDYNESVRIMIEACLEENDGIFHATSDDMGLFRLSNVKLKPNYENNYYVVCRYQEGDFPCFTFRKIKVVDRYWGALITQSSAVHEFSGDIHSNTFPSYYTPGININGSVSVTMGRVSSVFSTYALYLYSVSASNTAYYSYCINEYTEEDPDVERWCQIGPTGYIWAELNNINISYLWSLGIEEAYMELKSGGNTEVKLCGYDSSRIPLTLVFPEQGVSAEEATIQRHSIPPDALILKSEKPLSFTNDEWKLVVTYKYRRLEPFRNEFTIWPVGLDEDFSINKFVASPYTISHEEGAREFSISNAGNIGTKGTFKVMAYVVDEFGRIQTAAATKLLHQGCTINCRSIDIRYKYSADGISYDLEPSAGFFTWRGPPVVKPNSNGTVHAYNNKCGDHECKDPYNCIGPVWFPFNDCTTVDFYNVLNGAAQCTYPMIEAFEPVAAMGPGAWRYCLPEEYKAWTSEGMGQWAASCATSFYYHYSRALESNARFSGSGNKKAKISVYEYLESGWALPPFGNKGREYVERFLVRDYASYVDLYSSAFSTKREFMPMVFDIEDLAKDVNCFADYDRFSDLHEPFYGYSILNNYTSDFLSETISDERYRFDDIIDPIRHYMCMYPPPLIYWSGRFVTARYSFKNNNHVWAWQEYWKDIERNINSSNGQFRFMDLIRPDYYFDVNKKEHRLITDEGDRIITFTPPEFEDDEDGNREMSVYPSIKLDEGKPRFFKLIYTNYTDASVEWQDESSTGQVGGSGGDGEGNIYESANNGPDQNGFSVNNNPQWCHSFNTLFDASATAEPSEDRSIFLGPDDEGDEVHVYYNSGLVVGMPQNRLCYLPMNISQGVEPGEVITNDDNSIIIATWGIDEPGKIPIAINLTGTWGTGIVEGGGVVYSRPMVEVKESQQDVELDESGWAEGGDVVGALDPKTGQNMPMKTFEIKYGLSKFPDRMIKNLKYFAVRISAVPGQQINVVRISADMGSYVEATETVKVWERKYNVGETTADTVNADGPDSYYYRTFDWDNKNAGQYFPGESTTIPAGNYVSKLTMIGCGEHHAEDESLLITKNTLKEVEKEEQKKLYVSALIKDDFDTLNFSGVMPPIIRDWFVKTNAYLARSQRLTLTYKKVDWEHNALAKALKQNADFFQPGGHYFAWSEKAEKTRCYILGPIMTVYSINWVHSKHAGTEPTLDAGNSLAGWGRIQYYQGRLWQLGLFDEQENFQTADGLTQSQMLIYGGGWF